MAIGRMRKRHRMDRHFHRGVASGCLKPFGKPTSALLDRAADLWGEPTPNI
jgi:hypothetical protein